MKVSQFITATLCLLALSGAIVAEGEEYASVRTTKVAVATTAANGQRLSYLTSDRPEVTALIVEIPPGGETGWHLHNVPVYAYMIAGTIIVEMGDGKSYGFKKGRCHFRSACHVP